MHLTRKAVRASKGKRPLSRRHGEQAAPIVAVHPSRAASRPPQDDGTMICGVGKISPHASNKEGRAGLEGQAATVPAARGASGTHRGRASFEGRFAATSG